MLLVGVQGVYLDSVCVPVHPKLRQYGSLPDQTEMVEIMTQHYKVIDFRCIAGSWCIKNIAQCHINIHGIIQNWSQRAR